MNTIHNRVLSAITAILLLLTSTGFAAWDGGPRITSTPDDLIVVDMNKRGTIVNAGALPSAAHVKSSKYTALWGNHPVTTRITFKNLPLTDWTEYDSLEFWAYSTAATGNNIGAFVQVAPEIPGSSSYGHKAVAIDWTGWKLITVPLGGLQRERMSGVSRVMSIYFAASGWSYVPNPQAELYIDSIHLKKSSQNLFTEALREKAQTILKEQVAVYDQSPNLLKDGALVPIDDKGGFPAEIGGAICAPVSLFQNHLGATVSVKGGTAELTRGAQTASVPTAEQNGVVYIPLAEAAHGLDMELFRHGGLCLLADRGIPMPDPRDKDLLYYIAYSVAVTQIDPAGITREDYAAVKRNWRKYLVGDETNDMHNPEVAAKVKRMAATGEAAWKGMSKDKNAPVLWGTEKITTTSQMSAQYTKMYQMAEAYATYGSHLYQDKRLREDIFYALDWLYENLYGPNEIAGRGWRSITSFNWMDWEISTPRRIIEALILLGDDITVAQSKKYLQVFDRLVPTAIYTLDNDQTNKSNLVIGAAVLQEDAKRLQAAAQSIVYMIREVDSGEGFFEDGSFIRHIKSPYTGHYGAVFYERLTPITKILTGTKFNITNPIRENFSRWIIEAFAPVMFRGSMMSMVNGRRPNSSENSQGAVILRSMVEMLDVLKPSEAAKVKSIIRHHVSNNNMANHYSTLSLGDMSTLTNLLADDTIEPYNQTLTKMFYNMDRFVHHRPGYSIGIAMSSSRIFNYESINNINKRGWYTGDGMLYHYTGDLSQYESVFWSQVNAYRMPGVTADTQQRKEETIRSSENYLSSKDFVGGVADGRYGVAAMELESYHHIQTGPVVTSSYGNSAPEHSSTLEAKKAWFFFDDEVVALGADITANDGFNVETTLENRKLKKSQEKKGAVSVEPLKILSATATGDDGNVPENALDDDHNTRWSLEGRENCHLILELDEPRQVGYAGIAFFGTTEGRQAIFDLEVSMDGANWTTVFSGRSSGETTNFEPFDMKGARAKFVRFNGYGRTNSMWNSINEFRLYPPREDGQLLVDIRLGTLAGSEDVYVDGQLLPKEDAYERQFENAAWASIEDVGGFYLAQSDRLYVKKTDANPSFLELWVDHGVSPQGAAYAYAVLPGKNAEQTAAYAQNPGFEVLSNTAELQAVRHKTLPLKGYVFWKEGSFEDVAVTHPLILMTNETDGVLTIHVSDPTKKLKEAEVVVQGNFLAGEHDDNVEITVAPHSARLKLKLEGASGKGFFAQLNTNSKLGH